MLALSRKPGEKVVIGTGITLTVVKVRGKLVRLAFDAPEEVRILRSELTWWQEEPAGAAGQQTLRASGEGAMADPSDRRAGNHQSVTLAQG
jgi:carbon storage regulator CsrA